MRVQRRHSRDAKSLSDCPPGQALFITEPHNFTPAEDSLRPADSLSGCTSRFDAGKRAFTDHLSFKFRHAGENLEQQAACGVLLVSIERLARGDESDAEACQRSQLLIEVEHRPAKPVNLVDHDAIEFALGGVGHQAIKSGAAGFDTGKASVDVFAAVLPVTS